MSFPVLFVSHGAPSVALEEDDYTRALESWAALRPPPRAVVVALLEYARRAPHPELAMPTTEHFDPLLFVLGSGLPRERATPVFGGFRYGSLSMRSFALAPASSEARA